MRIGINALFLLPGKVGGSEVYLRNLVRSMARVAPENEYLLYVNRESAGLLGAEGIREVQCNVAAESRPMRILYEQTMLPILARRHGLDALLSAGMTAPFFCPVTSVLTVYDLQHVNEPQNFNRWYLLFLKTIISLSARSAKSVLTLSEKSRRDIVRVYGLSPERVAVTYLAADRSVFYRRSEAEIASLKEKYGLPEEFILYIASSLPHKNYERLLCAFAEVRRKMPDIKLVLIGARDYGHEAIRARIASLGLSDGVLFLGWLPFEEIPVIYSAASLFVFPSLHEGFGIPVLEAFASGTPVVCSRIEPLDEVAGDAALFVDPLSADAIAEGILRVLGDSQLKDALRAKGLKRAGEFSWERTASRTLSFIEQTRTGFKQ
ncbi:MAG TPA: glycosyltransferase family 1 protein [Thermodesulfobacteriota bacterium]